TASTPAAPVPASSAATAPTSAPPVAAPAAPAPATAGISTPILLQSDSGTLRPADGIWVACHAPSENVREEHVISGTKLTFTTYRNTTGPLCTGGTVDPTQTANFTVTGVSVVNGNHWLTGMRLDGPAPAKASGSGTLATAPKITMLSVTGTFGGNPIT